MSRIEIKENVDIFKCPICSSPMNITNMKSLLCTENHCFDISKKGYVNFLSQQTKADYDKELFASRSIVCKSGFFKPMTDKIVEIILHHGKFCDDKKLILDVGCGEGSHLSTIIKMLSSDGLNEYIGVGIDISRDGIQIASREYPDNIWCVANLANNPFQNNKFNYILNILTPSNYREFNRLLRNSGLLIKVVPQSEYLKELREAFYGNSGRQTYSNEMVVEHFKERFNLIEQIHINYTYKPSDTLLPHILTMTPLTWKIESDRIEKIIESGIKELTVALSILIGKPLNH